mmetsp:Transcript_67540/g.133292  ORF Transcript_67540/g.133292 Transcript_67540/m.133292 type:complete len:316 (+) Transcript_67540:3-950(+)
MNAVAKWSFVEVFFFCLAAVVTWMDSPKHKVRVKVANAGLFDVRANAGDFSFDAFIELLPGAMSMILAIVLVTAITHWLVYELDPPQPKLAARRSGGIPALIATSGALLFLLLAVEQTVLVIDRKGFLGNALGNRSEVDISLHTMISTLRQKPFLKEQATIQVLSIFAGFLAVVAPIFEMVLLIASLYSAESKVELSCQLRRVAEWLYSFDCVEVFLFTCVIILFDFDSFVAYMLKDECYRMYALMTRKTLDKVGLLYLYDDTCVKIEAQLGYGFWFFLVAVVLRSLAWRLARAPLHSEDSEAASAMMDLPGEKL